MIVVWLWQRCGAASGSPYPMLLLIVVWRLSEEVKALCCWPNKLIVALNAIREES